MIATETRAMLEDLPGGERALRGLEAVARGERSMEVLWLEMARTRLRENGIDVPGTDPEVHLALHRACLEVDARTGHATYRALNEELSSLLDALEARRRRSARERP